MRQLPYLSLIKFRPPFLAIFFTLLTSTTAFAAANIAVIGALGSIPLAYALIPTYPLYAEAAELYENTAPYDLTQEAYDFEELWSTPVQSNINLLPQSYNSPIVSRGEHTFILFVDTNHRMKIAQLTNEVYQGETFIDNTLYQPAEFYINTDGDPSNDVTVADYHRVKFEDAHHSVSLGIDENGYLHLVGDMHNYPSNSNPKKHLPLRYHDQNILYWRSDNPLDISSFSFKGDQATQCPQGTGFTYPFFFSDLYGKLHFTARGHQASNNAIRCVPFSSYDANSGIWTIIGGIDPTDPDSAPRTFYDDGHEFDDNNPNSTYSKTHPHGVFDRNNNMHLVAPLLSKRTENPWEMGNQQHFVDTILYAKSANGSDFTKADGSSITLPATIDLTANQADIAYSTSGYLAVGGNIAVDFQNNPYTVVKHKYPNGDPNQSFVIGWDGNAWINYGEIVATSTDFRLIHDPAGVMSYIPDSKNKFYRFWHPTDTLREVDLPPTWPYIKMIDYEYLKKTGNILGLSLIDNELTVVKVEITRPGMALLPPTTDTPTNSPPVITVAAACNGLDLSVTATDADGDPLTFTWSKSYGPGNVTYDENGTTTSNNTSMTVSIQGTYELKVSVSDGTHTRVSTCSIHSGIETKVETELSYETFESGFTFWESVSGSCSRNSNHAIDSKSVKIPDNGATLGLKNPLALSTYSTLRIEFSLVTIKYDTSPADTLQLNYSSDGGSTWTTVRTITCGTDFYDSNNKPADLRAEIDLQLSNQEISFTDNALFRIVSGSNSSGEYAYLDNIRITGTYYRPSFTNDPISGIGALAGVNYGQSLSGLATDQDGGTLTYSKTAGPSWLNIASDGTLTGIPTGSHIGMNIFTVTVEDPNANTDTATLQIAVSTIDSDGDGLTNDQEIALGTDPENPDSTFTIREVTHLPLSDKFRITWPSATGVLYRIKESTNLTDWTDARDWAPAQTPPADTYELNLTPPSRYFKVEADIQ